MSQTQQVEARLRGMILGLDVGPGERLTERWIENRLDASRTPIRAALLRLEAEGLVRRKGRGWTVSPIDLAELDHVFVYREAVETAAIRLTCLRGDAVETLAETQPGGTEGRTREEWHRAGMDFHCELARLSGNDFLYRAVRDAMVRLSRARWLEIGNEAARDRGFADHHAIVAAVRARDPEGAARLLGLHIQTSRNRLLAALREDRRSLRAQGVSVVAA